ncbi:FAD-dependent oxidoreductase [Loktanella sp. SALINAS62]|uniref:NAD(P)/FAD-dependent oxidoreductase n=1 Tax=Loktanella sp. SALINAS62 TaxID=2706124 RepID=UPI001B8C2A7A|nr:FAD-dependent oxidoreductase [Loktanella sp. SALINAS62]MBS1302569.1 FAD-dependent oxidoreductase [Loktanella sp. SALINAS62]
MTTFHKALTDVTFYPLWLDNTAAPDTCAHLVGRTETDLLIVGGGFTGLWAAIIAKQRDPARNVTLIEAGKVAHGASGRPGGIVSTSVIHGLGNAKRVFPADMDVLERLGIENLDGWRDTITQFGIDADLEWTGEMTVAVNRAHLDDLHREFALHQQHGHDAVLLDRAQTQAELASPLFEGAIWSRQRTGTVHPAKLAWGLKAIALTLGVRVHEHTPMLDVSDQGHQLRITTHDGRIDARRVLFATNAWGAGHRHIKRYVVAMRDRVLATEPLTAEQMDRIGWTNRQGVYDTRKQLNYMRLTRDNRIVYGGRIGYYFNDATDPAGDRQLQVYDRLAGYFHDTFPQLDDVKFSHAWSGPIDLTTRMAVHLQPYYGGKGVYAGGYSGFGVTASRFGARLALERLDDTGSPDLDLALASSLPGRIPPEPFRWMGAALTMRALDHVDTKGGWRKAWIRLVHRLGFPL